MGIRLFGVVIGSLAAMHFVSTSQAIAFRNDGSQGGASTLANSCKEVEVDPAPLPAHIADKIDAASLMVRLAREVTGEVAASGRLRVILDSLDTRIDQITAPNSDWLRPDRETELLSELARITSEAESLPYVFRLSSDRSTLTVSGALPTAEWFSRPDLLTSLTYAGIDNTTLGDEVFEILALAKELEVLSFGGGAPNVTGSKLEKLTAHRLRELHLGNTGADDDSLVGLARFPKLNELQLHDTSVTSGVLRHLINLNALLELNLARTHVRDVGFAQIANLERLESLNLNETEITGESLAHIAELTNLKRLDLEQTQIDDESLVHLSSLDALEFLTLERTLLTGVGFEALGSLNNLVQLNLNRTRVGDSAIRRLGDVNRLSRIELSSTRVSDAAVNHLTQTAQLTYIDLYGTHITDRSLEHLQNQQGLQRLLLGGTQITDDGLQSVANLKELRELDLSGTRITDDGLRYLAGLRNLSVLRLGGTLVTSSGIRHLADLEELRVLDLGDTRLQDKSLEIIARLRSLVELDLSATGVTDAGVAQLAANGQLRSLVLDATQVSGESLPALRRVSNLRTLSLDESLVDDEAIRVLQDYPSLAVLSLNRTSISDVGARFLGDGLEALEVGHTEITDEGLRAIQRNSQLQSLGLGGTAITNDGLSLLRAMPSLRSLDLSKTTIGDLGVDQLIELRQLDHLDLSATLVTDLGAETLLQMDQLESLNLEGTRITVHGHSLLEREQPELLITRGQPWEWDRSLTFFVDDSDNPSDAVEVSSPELQELTGLTYLHIEDRMLTKDLLRSLKDVASLRHLSFRGSRLSDRELADLSGLPQVTSLDLSHTRISDDGLRYLADFRSLRELNLRGTAIRGDGLIHLQEMSQLQSVDLGNTHVHDGSIRILAKMTGLRRVILIETPISDDAIVELAALPDLQFLDLYGTKLTDRCASSLSQIRGLRFCYLSNTEIGDDGIERLAALENLEELGMDGTRITDSSLATISQLRNLRRLRLGRTSITGLGLTAFVPPLSLTSLELVDLPVDDKLLQQVKYGEQIESLDLSGTRIGNSGLDTLADWPNLRELDIRDTAVTSKGISSFVAERPDVQLQTGSAHQPMDGWSIALLAIYSVVVVSICFYGTHRLILIVLFLRSRQIRLGPPKPPAMSELPHVTVQLPIFNEPHVARRVIESVCALKYPRERLQIQVLDDSTGEDAILVRTICSEWRSKGHDIEVLHRDNREGYKGGALREGMRTSRGEFIAMFDADFVPPKDFLERVLPYFVDERVGVVQAAWSHLNRAESWLTQCQAIFLDGHFFIEQAVRSQTRRWFNFNGTAGVWRKSCIEEAGGWSHDTLTEDTDLSYRAQLAGWQFLFLPQVSCEAELPSTMTAFLGQQHRWSKGLTQTAKKLLPSILASRAPLTTRIEAWCHLTAPMMYVVMFVLTLIALPALYISTPLNRLSTLALVLGVASLCFGTISTALYYMLAQRAQGRGWWSTFIRLPVLMGLGIGISAVNTRAVISALVGWRSPFVRTPKFAGRDDLDQTTVNLGRRRPAQGWLELVIAGMLVACLVLAFIRPFTLIGAPFLLMFALGYLGVGVARVMEPIRQQEKATARQSHQRTIKFAPWLRPGSAVAGMITLSVISMAAFAGIRFGLTTPDLIEQSADAESNFGIDLTFARWQTSGETSRETPGAIRQVHVVNDSLSLMIELDARREQGEIYLDLAGPLEALGRSLDSNRVVSFELEFPERFTGEFQAFVRDRQNRSEYGSMEFIERHDRRSRAVVTISPSRWVPPMGYQDEGFEATRGMTQIGLKVAAQSDRVRGAGYRGFSGFVTVSNIRIEERPSTLNDEPEIRLVERSTLLPPEPTDTDAFAASSGLVRPWPLGYAFSGPLSDNQLAKLEQTFQMIQSTGGSYARIYLGDYRTGLELESNGLILRVEDDFADFVQTLIETANRFGVTPMICLTDNTMVDGRGIESPDFILEGEHSTRFVERVLMRFVRDNRGREVVWDIFNEPENATAISLRSVQGYVDRVLQAGRAADPDARFTVVSRGRTDLVFWQGRGLDLYAHNIFTGRSLAESTDSDLKLDAPIVVAEIDPDMATAENLASIRNAGYEAIGIWGWGTGDKYDWDESKIDELVKPFFHPVE